MNGTLQEIFISKELGDESAYLNPRAICHQQNCVAVGT